MQFVLVAEAAAKSLPSRYSFPDCEGRAARRDLASNVACRTIHALCSRPRNEGINEAESASLITRRQANELIVLWMGVGPQRDESNLRVDA